MLQIVFVSNAARSVDTENEHSPPVFAYTLYIERRTITMFIDCTECGKHVFAHVFDKTLACMDLTEAVLCDECASEMEDN